MYKPYDYFISHFDCPNDYLKKIAETKYTFLRELYKNNNFKYNFNINGYTIQISNNEGMGKILYSYIEEEIPQENKKETLNLNYYGVISLITTPVFTKDSITGATVYNPHNNIIDKIAATSNKNIINLTGEYNFYPRYSIDIQKEKDIIQNNMPVENGYFSYFSTPITKFDYKNKSDIILYKRRMIYPFKSLKSDIIYNSHSYPSTSSCGNKSSISESKTELKLCDDFLIGYNYTHSFHTSNTIWSSTDNMCVWRFSNQNSESKSISYGFPLEMNTLSNVCPNNNNPLWDTVSLDNYIIHYKTISNSITSYSPSEYLKPNRYSSEEQYTLSFGDIPLMLGEKNGSGWDTGSFTDADFNGDVCGTHHCYGIMEMGGNAPRCGMSNSIINNKPYLASDNTDALSYDIFIPNNSNAYKYYSVIFSVTDEVHNYIANPSQTCVCCPDGCEYDFWHSLCCGKPESEYYKGIPPIAGQISSEWNNASYSEDIITLKAYLDIDGVQTNISEGKLNKCGDMRKGYYQKVTSGTYIYETYFRNIGAYMYICIMLAYGVCDYLFRDTPRIEYYDLSNTIYKDMYESAMIYSYIQMEANGCDEAKDTLKKCVIGYKLYGKDGIDDVYKEQEYHKLEGKPDVSYTIESGNAGEMRKDASHKFYFFVSASNPFFNSDVSEIIIDDPKLDTPNGGITLKISYPKFYKEIVSYNIYTFNLTPEGHVDQDAPFKLIKVMSNTGESEIDFTLIKIYPSELGGVPTHIYYGFMLNEDNWMPIRILDTTSELINEGEYNG